jgi:hypothetical protein
LWFFEGYFKTTTGTPFAIATLHDRSFDNFRDECFGEVTNFRMNAYSRGERTAVAADHDLVAVLLDFSRPADCFQHFDRVLHATL